MPDTKEAWVSSPTYYPHNGAAHTPRLGAAVFPSSRTFSLEKETPVLTLDRGLFLTLAGVSVLVLGRSPLNGGNDTAQGEIVQISASQALA